MNCMRNKIAFVLMCAALLSLSAFAQTPYRTPPQEILNILDAPATRSVSISPTRDRMLLAEPVRYPSIAEVSEPMLRLAGLRINPNTNGPHRPNRIVGLTLKNIPDAKEQRIEVPANANLSVPEWSYDGKHFAFTNTLTDGIELWIGDAATGTVRRIQSVMLNAAYGDAVRWMPDNATLLCKTVVARRGAPPAKLKTPAGPNIQESYGKPAPVRTYQDLLQNPADEALFEYYATSQLVIVNAGNGKITPLGKPAVFASVQPSPDGNRILVTINHKPYSYLLPAFAFPKEVEVWDRAGKLEYKLAGLPLADQVPIEGVPTGPRSYTWRPTQPATLVWVEALDGGNPKEKVPYRDRVVMLKAPFQGSATEIAKTEHRYRGMMWGEKDGMAILSEFDRSRLRLRAHLLNVDEPQKQARIVWDRSIRDRYNDPGDPLMRTLPSGDRVMLQHANHIYLTGSGASQKGDRPFIDRFDLTTMKSERLFQSDDKSYESVLAILKDDGSSFITRHETQNDPPNYFLRSLADGSKKALTGFPDPAPQLRAIRKQLVTYKRGDGVQLSFTLYLPMNYKEGTRLPTVLWAYPLEFTDADVAGQVTGSANRFTTISGYSHLFFAMLGYAVLDSATMPVVGDPETVNNTYVEQIVASAQAAIDKAVEMGVTDRNRIGVGGHSYGAFMTANLLAHSDLFKAGIARSGAYNRTLTPFGFQSERRTLWEAPEMYLKVSPFMFANKIKEPILLIHGEADNNTGTFPIQSERMYQALKGNGGNVRYVTLPNESHGYSARESVEHALWEMVMWFDKHVKAGQEVTKTVENGNR